MAVETLEGEFARTVWGGHGLFGALHVAFGRYNFSTVVVEDGDIRKLFYLPAHVLVVGGFIAAGDLDTGTETLDVDLGWADNGGASSTYEMKLAKIANSSGEIVDSSYTFTNMVAGSASATGFLNTGVWSGDAVTDLIPAGQNYRPLIPITGPIYFSRKTQVQFEVNAPSATPADKEAWATLYYMNC
jgi:hypothetical protein